MIVPMAALAHHRAHIAPVARVLGVDDRHMPRRLAGSPDDVALVASYGDVATARRSRFRRIVLMQHGAGQSYGGDTRTARHPCYPGGDDNDDVGLFLVPNEHAADRWQTRYPDARVEVVGCPRLADLPTRATDDAYPVVAVSFHWNYHSIPEMRSAFDHFAPWVAELPKAFRVIGHGHPKRRDLAGWYREHGIEYVPDFADVLRRADLYVVDNSSTLFEFAATDRPVVVLNAPWYRLDAHHGLRFWDAAGVGINVSDGAFLGAAIRYALADPDYLRVRRRNALRKVYADVPNPAHAAAAAILDFKGSYVAPYDRPAPLNGPNGDMTHVLGHIGIEHG